MGIPIVTNKQKIFGAASVVFEDVLVSISQRVDGNYYLLPSSRHEMIVVPEGTSCRIIFIITTRKRESWLSLNS